MKEFKKIFEKVGGKHLLKQYTKLHILCFSLFITLVNGFSKKSLEIVRLSIENKIMNKFRRRYSSFIEAFRMDYEQTKGSMTRTRSNKVWICWFQGIEHSPEMVKKCYESALKNLENKDVIIITEDNFQEFITLPDYIMEKYKSGIITKTHLSDMIRLELLIQYGGIWVDATVFFSDKNIPDYMLSSDLFLFQCLKPGRDGHSCVASSWYITACTNHPILLMTKALFYEYWKTEEFLVDYFLIHDFLQLAIEAFPEEWDRVIPCSNSIPHILLLNLFSVYDKTWLEAIYSMTCIHKLSYKFTEEQLRVDNSYYKHLMKDTRLNR